MTAHPSGAVVDASPSTWAPLPGEVGLYDLLAPVLRRWRTVLAVCVAFVGLTAGAVLVPPREFRAAVSLSTVANPRSPGAGAGLTALLSANNVVGLQSTPALIVLLSRQNGVLARVAEAPMAPGARETIGDRLRAVKRQAIPRRDLPRIFAGEITAAFDRPPGVISVGVVSHDSVFARAAVGELVAEISRTFSRASRAQGSELRGAMDERVDSAGRTLRRAQESLRSFRAVNREVAVFSSSGVQLEDLQRAASLAQTVYMQAVTDREAAIARELEDTPAVVVLDGLPRDLPFEPRHAAVKLAAAAIAGLVLTTLFFLVRDGIARARAPHADVDVLSADPLATRPTSGPPPRATQTVAPHREHGRPAASVPPALR